MSANPRAILNAVLPLTTLADRGAAEALDLLAEFVDAAGDLHDAVAARHAVALSNTIDSGALSPAQACELHLFRANAWSNARRSATHLSESSWLWEREEVEKEVFHFRAAMRAGIGAESDLCST